MAPDLPSIELLEATHQFPCVFHFKAIGLSTHCFTGRVLDAVKRELAEDAEPSFSTRSTPNGKHIGVTVEPIVDSAAQVLAIYEQLRGVEGLVMMM